MELTAKHLETSVMPIALMLTWLVMASAPVKANPVFVLWTINQYVEQTGRPMGTNATLAVIRQRLHAMVNVLVKAHAHAQRNILQCVVPMMKHI